ncbi:hypothetical protein UFOVP111_110 [uncultured Caudovirales phage]|uniref:Uncharacterized protein n=1 Tax=uncultured Caudovirales phage TaxID=2100421 RepID=A0A6J5L687_9CAUD|nr:hypothetical protein UFOVP111_110 [uncultured Caudovirales phage]
MTYPTDDAGHPQVDFVWGNMPMQPNDERDTNLDPSLDNHVIADIGWSNYPSYIPNYSGDDDSELEYVVPDLLRKTLVEADALLDNHNTDLNLFARAHNLTVNNVTSDGKTVRVYAYDTDSWGDDGTALIGLRVGDELYFTDLLFDGDPGTNFGTVKVTAVNDEGEDPATYFEFKVATAIDPALDTVATGSVWAGPNLVNVITLQRFWNPAGSIKNPGTNVHVRYFSVD